MQVWVQSSGNTGRVRRRWIVSPTVRLLNPLPTAQDAGLASEPIQTLRRRYKKYVPAKVRTPCTRFWRRTGWHVTVSHPTGHWSSLVVISTNYYYYYVVIVVVSCHMPFLPGTSSLQPTSIPTAQASIFILQYFPHYLWSSKCGCHLYWIFSMSSWNGFQIFLHIFCFYSGGSNYYR